MALALAQQRSRDDAARAAERQRQYRLVAEQRAARKRERQLQVDQRRAGRETGRHGRGARQAPSDEAPPSVPGGGEPRASRNRLGTIAFAVAALGALLAVFPASAVLGLLLCLIAVVPAALAVQRVWQGTATNRGQASTALVLAPVFFIVAAVVVATNASPSPSVDAPYVPAARAAAGSLTADPSVPVPAAGAAPSITTASPAPPASTASAGVSVVTRLAAPAPATVTGLVHVLAAAPFPPTRTSISPDTTARALTTPPPSAPAPVPAPTIVPAPVDVPASTLAPTLALPPAPTCDETTHYVNSSGSCILRPVDAPSPPPGATAQCVDGSYSFSAHRQGTCSHHGGVGTWL